MQATPAHARALLLEWCTTRKHSSRQQFADVLRDSRLQLLPLLAPPHVLDEAIAALEARRVSTPAACSALLRSLLPDRNDIAMGGRLKPPLPLLRTRMDKIDPDGSSRVVPEGVAKMAENVGAAVEASTSTSKTPDASESSTAIGRLKAWAGARGRAAASALWAAGLKAATDTTGAGVASGVGAVASFLSSDAVGAAGTAIGSAVTGTAALLASREAKAQAAALVREVEDTKVWLADIKRHINAGRVAGLPLCTTHALVAVVRQFQEYFRANFLSSTPAALGLLVLWPDYYRKELLLAKSPVAEVWSEYNAERTDRLERVMSTVLNSGARADDVAAAVRFDIASDSDAGADARTGHWCGWVPPADWDNCPECTREHEVHHSTRQAAVAAWLAAPAAPPVSLHK